MTKQYICGGDQYICKSETIGLTVVFGGLPSEIRVEGYTLLLKSSFHVSLVCTGKIIEKYNISTPDFTNSVISDFCEFTKKQSVNLINWSNEFRFVTQNERRSIIAMCEISNLNKFFDLLNNKYQLGIEYPPTHVTLYTLQLDKGIFLTTSEDIEELTKIVKAPNGIVLT
jgi:hypothetical protein